jgi:hypothetical protein
MAHVVQVNGVFVVPTAADIAIDSSVSIRLARIGLCLAFLWEFADLMRREGLAQQCEAAWRFNLGLGVHVGSCSIRHHRGDHHHNGHESDAPGQSCGDLARG